VQNGRDILLADDARAFSEAVIRLLRDRELRRRYETAAAETAARYDWPAIGERFCEVLQGVADEKVNIKTPAQAELARGTRAVTVRSA
jgi:glycosyltransferase involved in cell wall biosynthesis